MYRERMGEGHGVVESDRVCHGAGGGGGTSNNSREADGDRYEWLFQDGTFVGREVCTYFFSRGLSGGSAGIPG